MLSSVCYDTGLLSMGCWCSAVVTNCSALVFASAFAVPIFLSVRVDAPRLDFLSCARRA